MQTAKEALESFEAKAQAHILEMSEFVSGLVREQSGQPPICAVCGQGSRNSKEIRLVRPQLHHSPRVSDSFIIQNCIIKCNSVEFRVMFGNSTLDGLMLDKNGVVDSTSSQACLNVCPECYFFFCP